MAVAPRGRTRRQRALSVILAGAVVLAHLLLAAANPAGACACGAFIDPDDERNGSNVLQETAVLALRGGTQSVVMGLELDASRTGSTLLMPTPSVPEVSAAQSGTLREMAVATAPREVIEYDYWGESPFSSGDGSGGAPEATGAPQVTVHEQSRIGSYEVAVLRGEADGVRTWLADNGYELPEEISALIDPYVEDGWTFTAVRYAADAVLSGDIEPLRFDFATDELIYPMRFSQAAQTSQTIHLFVLGETAVRRSDPSAAAQRVERPWIGDPTDHEWTWSDATLREFVGEDLEVDPETGEFPARARTVTEFEIRGEPESFTSDLAFEADPDADAVIPTVTTTKLVTMAGIPVGYWLVLAGVVTTVALLIALGSLTAAVRARTAGRAGRPTQP